MRHTDSLSKRFLKDIKQLVLVLLGAIAFSFLMGVIANVLVNYVVMDCFELDWLILIIVSISAAVILVWLIYFFYVFRPNSKLIVQARVPIIYDKTNIEVIKDPFDGYFPQQLAWQVFSHYSEGNDEVVKQRIETESPFQSDANKNHILTELFEYVLLMQLRDNHRPFTYPNSYLGPIDTIHELPTGLEKNVFLSYFKKLTPKDIFESSLKSIKFELPVSTKLEYKSSVSSRPRVKNDDWFELSFQSNRVELSLHVKVIYMGIINTMQGGPAPIFEGVYIRPYWAELLKKKLGTLYTIEFFVDINAKSKSMLGLKPNIRHINWIHDWMINLVYSDIWHGLDFDSFRQQHNEQLFYHTYEKISEVAQYQKDM